jgi:hypothetical protein
MLLVVIVFNESNAACLQIIPTIKAISEGAKTVDVEIPFDANPAMKAQEQDNIAFIKKRWHQSSLLLPAITAAFEEFF